MTGDFVTAGAMMGVPPGVDVYARRDVDDGYPAVSVVFSGYDRRKVRMVVAMFYHLLGDAIADLDEPPHDAPVGS